MGDRAEIQKKKYVNLEMDRPIEKSGGRMPRGEGLAKKERKGERLARQKLGARAGRRGPVAVACT